MKTVFIYALSDPFTGLVRYIGKAVNLKNRLRAHISKSRLSDDHRSRWIGSLLQKGQKPVLTVIDEVREDEWQACEAAYIQFFRDSGCDLTNTTRGGEGLDNVVFTEIHRARLAEANIGKKLTPEHCAKLSVALIGNKRTLGFVHSLETCKKRSEASKKVWEKRKAADPDRYVKPPRVFALRWSVEARAKVGAVHRGKVVSAETRERQSLAQKARQARERLS